MIPEERPFVKGEMKKCGAADTPGGGNAAHQGEGLETEAQTHREGALSIDLPGYLCDPTGARADGRIDAVTQFQPRTPGGYLGGNALSGFWFLLPAQKKPPAGSVPTGLGSLNYAV